MATASASEVKVEAKDLPLHGVRIAMFVEDEYQVCKAPVIMLSISHYVSNSTGGLNNRILNYMYHIIDYVKKVAL
jgi:hypothetical protein